MKLCVERKKLLFSLLIFLICPLLGSASSKRDIFCCDYTCSEIPLICGAFDVQGHVGFAPIAWADRGDVATIQCPGVAAQDPVVVFFKEPSYFKLFNLPWTLGGQLGYAIADNIRTYFEFNYFQGSGKDKASLETKQNPASTVVFDMNNYKLYDAFLGFQYFFNRWCNRYSLILGGKIGLVYHYETEFSATIEVPPAAATQWITKQEFFENNLRVAGGFNIGVDICICDCWNAMFMGEIVANCGPKSNPNIAFGQKQGCNPPPLAVPGINNLLLGSIGAELRFPFTAGLRYTF